MDVFPELERLFQPLENELGDGLKAVMVYGSAARGEMKEGSDIDVLIFLDDIGRSLEEEYQLTEQAINSIEEDAPEEMNLHIQPPKTVTRWWELMLEGEPWTVTAMKDAKAVYDPENFVSTLKRLLDNSGIGNRSLRAEELFKRGRKGFLETNREKVKMVKKIQKEVETALEDLLIFQGRSGSDTSEVRKELVEDRNVLDEKEWSKYRRLMEFEATSETSFQKLEDLFEDAIDVLEKFSGVLEEVADQEKEWLVEESFSEVSNVCSRRLGRESQEKELLEEFRKEFVEEGDVSDEYGDFLQELLELKREIEEGKTKDIELGKVYSISVKTRDFEAAIDNEKRSISGDLVEETVQPPSLLDEFVELLTDDFEEFIMASWALTVEELEETEDSTVVIVLDDTRKDKLAEIKEDILEVRNGFVEKEGFQIHLEFRAISDYWDSLRQVSMDMVREMKDAIPLYDDARILTPIMKLARTGRVEGTREAAEKEIRSSLEAITKTRNELMAEYLNSAYDMSVEIGQAILLWNNTSPPAQKKVSEKLEELQSEGKIREETVTAIKQNINRWKDLEHGQKREFMFSDLVNVEEDCRTILENAKSLKEDL